MKTFILFLLSFTTAHASAIDTKALIKKMREKRAKAESIVTKSIGARSALMNIYFSPQNPKQGEAVTIFAEMNSNFTGQETVASFTLDSAAITLEHPTPRLWIFRSPGFSEIKSHTLSAVISIRDEGQSNQLRQAIQQLDSEIFSLNQQIANSTSPEEITQLTAQRDQKINAKNSLITALADLLKPIGTVSRSFEITANEGSNDFPRISSVTPGIAAKVGGASITVNGHNFTASPQLIIGGVSTAVSTSTATTVSAVSPAFATDGIKDVELRFTNAGITKNAILKNAFYVTSEVNLQNQKPVAVAGAVQNVPVNTLATLNGINSYDVNNDTISYEWSVVSAPEGSSFHFGDIVGTGPYAQITPNIPGYYVFQLIVRETNTVDHFESFPSITALQVDPAQNAAPNPSAQAIVSGHNGTITRQITHGDADTWQSHGYTITKQSTFGTATVSESGLITFTAGETEGTDSLQVVVFDNGNPPLSATFNIPVTVQSNSPPYFTAPGLAFEIQKQGTPIHSWLDINDDIADDDGQIVDCIWNVNGITVHGDPTDFCFAEFDFPAAGSYPVSLTIVDNLGATATTNDTAVMYDTPLPTSKFTINPISGSAPLSLVADASTSTVPGGAHTIDNYRWRFFDGSGNILGSVVNHTIENPGIYNIQHREFSNTAAGNVLLWKSLRTNIYVGETPPVGGVPPIAQIKNPDGREKLVNQPITFDGTDSFDPTFGGGITNYAWDLGGEFTGSGSSISQAFSQPHNQFGCLTVTSAGGASHQTCTEYFVVNTGHAPRAVVTGNLEGIAPFTATIDASKSFDYDGTIVSYKFQTSENGFQEVVGGPIFNYTYNTSGYYAVNITAIDNDGNEHIAFTGVNVLDAKDKMKKKDAKISKREDDAPKQSEKQILAGACYSGNARACFDLSQIFAAENNQMAAQEYKTKACTLGYQPACTMKAGK